jgi:hypothetical protein
MLKRTTASFTILLAGAIALSWLGGCGRGGTPKEKNLLRNSSFESVVDNIPEGWRILVFRGLPDEKPAVAGVDDSLAADGKHSFYMHADEETRRFFMLSQEVEVHDVDRVRIRAAVRTLDVKRNARQYPQANLALTFYDADRQRFESQRFADRRTPELNGTSNGWIQVDQIVRVPANTRYIVVHCVLGKQGTIWFDDVSLEVPTGLPWKKDEGPVFTHYWLPGSPYPKGSIDLQEQLYEYYASRLGVPKEEWKRIYYYLYPDTTAMRKAIGRKGPKYVDFGEREIHSVFPVDKHEIVHLITDPIGMLPLALEEGTAFYLMDDFEGKPIQPLAQQLLEAGELPPLEQLLPQTGVIKVPPEYVIPAAASFVGYLIEFGGPKRFMDFYRRGSKFDDYQRTSQAFQDVYGGSFQEAESVWRKTLAAADFSKPQHPEQPKQ